MTLPTPDNFEKRIFNGINLPYDKKVYFNGFALTVSASDVMIVLESNGVPVQLLNAPHSVAKAFAQTLATLIEGFERDSEFQIPTLQEMEQKVMKANAKPK